MLLCIVSVHASSVRLPASSCAGGSTGARQRERERVCACEAPEEEEGEEPARRNIIDHRGQEAEKEVGGGCGARPSEAMAVATRRRETRGGGSSAPSFIARRETSPCARVIEGRQRKVRRLRMLTRGREGKEDGEARQHQQAP
mmetsp:Transcript_13449/g.39157  ORF Transcript_13449/g.39157 Transcript_13449/m.39157 type:complete len:143 (+) Transcript_13449:25-453(+)